MIYDDPTTVSLLLEKWLRDEPASTLDRYLRSAYLDLRRRLEDKTGQVEDITIPPGPVALPEWLPENTFLPPCEAELLTWLFSGRRLTIIRSGTGSGKTSALSFLANLFRFLSRPSSPVLPRNNLLVVDLQSLNPELFWEKLESTSSPGLVADKFLLSVCRELDAKLLSRFTNEVLVNAFSSLFLPKQAGLPPAALHNPRIASLANTLGTILRKTQPSALGKWNVILTELIPVASESSTPEEYLRSLSPHDLMEIRLAVLYELSEKLSPLPTALALDNVDNYPEYLQRKLIDSLKTITAQPFFRKGHQISPPLTISVFARLSTAARHAASYGSHGPALSFRTPHPADLVFLRLGHSLEQAATQPEFQALSKSDRAKVLSRAWYLWRSLAVNSPLRAVLSARAGTNIRNAFLYTREWILSPRIRTSPPIAEDFVQRIEVVFAAAEFLSRLQATVRHNFPAGRTDLLPGRTKVGKAADMLSGFLTDFCSAGEFTMKPGTLTHDEEKDFRHRLGRLHAERLAAFLEDREFSHVRRSCTRLIGDAVQSMFPTPLSKNELKDAMAAALEKHSERGPEVASSRDKDGAAMLLKSIMEGTYISTGESHSGVATYFAGHSLIEETLALLLSPARQRRDHSARNGRLKLESRLPSRWLAASVLITPDEPFQRHDTDAVNLFSTSGISLLEIPLIVVSILSERGGRTTNTGLLKEELAARGFESSAQIYEALREMVKLRHRLIYVGVRDDRDGVEDIWKKNDQGVYLSCAGSRYFSVLTRLPAYVQWALLEIEEFSEKLAIGSAWHARSRAVDRIKKVRRAFGDALGQEEARVSKREVATLAGVYKDGIRGSLMPIAWCYFNCLYGFVGDLYANRANDPEALDEARAWAELGKRTIAGYNALVGQRVPKAWEEELGFAGRMLEKARKPSSEAATSARRGRSNRR